jgi:hypothetical protein
MLTAVMMVVEITVGYTTNSMALLADGWHMASIRALLLTPLVCLAMVGCGEPTDAMDSIQVAELALSRAIRIRCRGCAA